MAKPRSGKKKNGIVKLKIVVEKLQKSLLLGKKTESDMDEFEEVNDSTNVPDDVKEGHFAVIAVDDDELKRFVIPLSYLTNPTFLRLLEQAAEEFGFDREGALTIPCRPSELERILSEQRVEDWDSMLAADWDSCTKTMWSLKVSIDESPKEATEELINEKKAWLRPVLSFAFLKLLKEYV